TITALVPESHAPLFDMGRVCTTAGTYPPVKPRASRSRRVSDTIATCLSNGMRVVLVPDSVNPVVSFRIASLGGKRFESPDNKGIMTFISHMLPRGAGGMDEVEIARRVEQLGGRLKSYSGHDTIGIELTVFSRFASEGLHLLGTLFREPSFPEPQLERERDLVLNRIRTQPDRPFDFAIKVFDETMFENHPYGYPKNGTPETVARFTRQDLAAAHECVRDPSSTVIVGVGRMDTDRTLQTIERVFGDMSAETAGFGDMPLEAPLVGIRTNTVTIPRAKAHLAVGFRAPTVTHEDRYPMEVLNNILSGVGGRLFVQLRDRRSLAYLITAFYRPALDLGVLVIYLACESSRLNEAISALFGEIANVRSGRINEKGLDNARRSIISGHKIRFQSSWARAGKIARDCLVGLGHEHANVLFDRVSEVSSEVLIAAIRKYLSLQNCAVAKIVPDDEDG
ncbi:MAG: pitrilysin family protein, partial [Pseudomonadota bacterium]